MTPNAAAGVKCWHSPQRKLDRARRDRTWDRRDLDGRLLHRQASDTQCAIRKNPKGRTMAGKVENRQASTHEKVERTQAKVARSAKVQEKAAVATTKSALRQEDSADRRTELSADRTIYAAERTYAAWMRTGLTSLAAGVGARALLAEHLADWLAAGTSVLLTLFAMFCFVAAVWREIDGHVRPHRDVRRLPGWILVTFSSFLVIVAGAVAVDLWSR